LCRPVCSLMQRSASAIQVEHISMVFGDAREQVKALDDVSLEINANEFFTLLGPSGCGKTTLLRLIAGFEQPTSGSIKLEGQALEGLPPFKRPVNTVFQSYALFPHLTVAQNIAFGLEESRLPKPEIVETVSKMLKLVKLEGYEGRKPTQLSGGQQQRVALARALANKPKVLLLDESLSALDSKLRKEMQLELKRLQLETGITFVFVTHDQEEALTMSDRIAVMRNGKVAQIGTPREIYNHPRSRYVADFIGETDFLTGTVEAGRLRLGGGHSIPLETDLPNGSSVTVAMRPECLVMIDDHFGGAVNEGEGIPATVKQIVYIGTDTVFYIEMLGQSLRARTPNNSVSQRDLGNKPGDKVRIIVLAGVAQVLEDVT
jgi:spermidine/putrescine transport system ATP-binding protein